MVDPEAHSVADIVRSARLTESFYTWERRGRGWDVWPYPVEPEPAFRPFVLESGSSLPVVDDARTPSKLGAWIDRFLGRGSSPPDTGIELLPEPEPEEAGDYRIAEIQIALASDVKVAPDLAEHFLLSLSTCALPITFEVVGTSSAISIQMACAEDDASHVEEQVRAYFPEAVLSKATGFLTRTWNAGKGTPLVVDFGLSQEFMRSLKTFARFEADPLIGLLGSLGDLVDEEVVVAQVLFQSARAPWAPSIVRSVTDWQGDPFFLDAPELVSSAQEKTSRPLFAAVIRVAVRTPAPERALQLARRVGGALAQVGSPSGNELVALSNDDYPDDVHVLDVLERKTHRQGMLLNSEELVSLVHPPSNSVRASRLTREHRRTKAVPKVLLGHEFCLGTNTHAGTSERVTIGLEQRLRHTHLVGSSGTGKSTLLLHMLVQDMEQGNGLALIDPHGDLIDQVLGNVPESRVHDVVLVDPADVDYPVGFNILSAHSELEKTLLASDLVAVFRRLSTSWGDQMTSVLSNAILAFLESPRGGTIADLRRFLVEAEFRKAFLAIVQDPEVVYYWQKEFPLLSGRPQAPLLTRLDTFLRPRLVRNMVTQHSSLDFTAIMNEGKILLVKLAQGAIGEENAALLGSLFVAKIHQLALGRQAVAEHDRRPFFVYLDEFQHFITPSMATLLTGARKYRLGLVLAHQELRQLWNQDRDVAGAVLANAATRICFRVGDDDAKKLEDGFSGFTARDIQNLGVGQAVCRVDRADSDFSLDAPAPLPAVLNSELRERIIEASRARYASRPVAQTGALPVETSEDVRTQKPSGSIEASRDPLIATQRRASVVLPEPSPVKPLSLPGRGGGQHKYLQELIRRWGEANGWRVTVEKAILDGLGRVDVALEGHDTCVACEVSVASTAEYEIGNVRKCLAAGFGQVVVVAAERKAAENLRKVISGALEDADSSKVKVLAPEQLFDFLGQFSSGRSSEGTTVHGYAVQVKYKGTANADARGRSVAKTVLGALKRLRTR